MELFEAKDPYHILGISLTASEAEISRAFHNKLRTARGDEEREKLTHAYGLISSQTARDRLKWGEMSSLSQQPPESDAPSSFDLEPLVRELAFLTPWELGDDA